MEFNGYQFAREEKQNVTANVTARTAAKMVSILGLRGSPVGLRFLAPEHPDPGGTRKLDHHRFCQALMLARHGESVVLNGDGLSCPAAAAAFGFRPLPEGLKTGKGLVGFGIVSDPSVGRRMFDDMPRLKTGAIGGLHLFPLDRISLEPDVVIIEDEVEKLMWIGLACLHTTGGERLRGSTAVLQATCVDAAVLPYLEKRFNFGYGCYGCRDATDIGPHEAVAGFPGQYLSAVVEHLEFLGQKAIPTSRGKKALAALRKGKES